jgi:YidC/Oxa1 family membrane protein insertase
MDTKRLIIFVIFSFSVLMLWDSWQQQQAPQTGVEPQHSVDHSVPQAAQPDLPTAPAAARESAGFQLQSERRVQVSTDLYNAVIDTVGGDLRQLELTQHRADGSTEKNFVLLDDGGDPMVYVAQTGLIGHDLPTHKAQFTSDADQYVMQSGSDTLEVRLSWSGDNGVRVDKVYTFRRGSYVIDVRYDISNGSGQPVQPSVYYQIVHDSESKGGSLMQPTFVGAAYYTTADKFNKIGFDDMEEANFSKSAKDGWIGLVQHYFVGAWIPETDLPREFYTKKLADGIYSMGSVSPLQNIAAGETLSVTAELYAGPQTRSDLTAAAPGLEYAVDYGWLAIIAWPLFWLLEKFYALSGNWGVAIILLTVLIKLAFYPLSAASYRSMAHMRELAPRLQRMKEQYGDDRQKMQQAMMELYRTEKINPLGGCLPILVQIPVFIALYWVLLNSVEMRHAPFMLWIDDLSAIDPYYVLPILMGATMIIQTRLNPKPADPVQAKVMMVMPVVFSVFFFFFPAGLVLYWLVNNILSIAQQWHINRLTEQETARKKAAKR